MTLRIGIGVYKETGEETGQVEERGNGPFPFLPCFCAPNSIG